jgi:hypothetical protein
MRLSPSLPSLNHFCQSCAQVNLFFAFTYRILSINKIYLKCGVGGGPKRRDATLMESYKTELQFNSGPKEQKLFPIKYRAM